MTFANFILNLRRRLQDRYTNTGTLISSASTDGVRWTSSELVDISNMAFLELSRMSIVYKSNPLFKELISLSTVYDTKALVSGDLIFTSPANVFKILSMSAGSSDNVYGEISSDIFTTYLAQNKDPRQGERFFAQFYNPTTKVKYVKVLPADNTTVFFSYIYKKDDYASTDITSGVELHINGMDDLLLDLAEREARDREHNWERSKILDQRIYSKIGVVANG